MKNNPRAAFNLIFVAALVVYFCSESLLRQAAVSNVNAGEFKLSKIIDELPASIRENVRYTLDKHAFLDRIKGAKTPDEKVSALTGMAMYVKEADQKDLYFSQVMTEYPDHSGAVQAYCHFLLKKDSPNQVSIEKYHQFIQKCPSIEQFQMWQMGYGKVVGTDKKAYKTHYEYLLPLFDMTPEYKDYFRLYDDLSKLAGRLGKKEEVEKAKELKNSCLTLPTISQLLKQKEMAEKNKGKPPKAQPKKKEQSSKNDKKVTVDKTSETSVPAVDTNKDSGTSSSSKEQTVKEKGT